MRHARSVLGLSVGCWLAFAPAAGAQGRGPAAPDRFFVTVNVGAQPQRRTLIASQSFSLYDEVATVVSTQRVRNGAMFELTTGYRLRPRLGLAIGVSAFSARPGGSTIDASIPDPVYVGRPAQVTGHASNLHHTERSVHVQAVWFVPVSDRIDVALSAGPSIIRVAQDVTATASVAAGTQQVVATPATETAVAFGFNVGFDGSYMFTPRYGAGLFLRYDGGSVNLPSATNVRIGGYRTGLGFRVRF